MTLPNELHIAQKVGYTNRLRGLVYEKVLEWLGYNVQNLRQCADDEILRNVFGKSPDKIITDTQMNNDLKDYLITYEDQYGRYTWECQADDVEHAKDQLIDAYGQDVMIVRVYLGVQG